MADFLFDSGPLGRGIRVDDNGRLLATGDVGSSGFIYTTGDTGRVLTVDENGRLRVNVTGVTASGGAASGEANTASNIGLGEGVFSSKVGVDLRFRSLLSGSGISIAGSGDTIRADSRINFLVKESGSRIGINNAFPQSLLHVGVGGDSPDNLQSAIYASKADPTSIVARDSLNNAEVYMEARSPFSIVGTTTNHSLSIRTFNTDRVTFNTDGTTEFGYATYSPIEQATSGAAVTINLLNSNVHKLTLGANTSLTLNNPKDGGKYQLILTQDDVGGRTVSWPANFLWRGSAEPTLTTTPSGIDIVSFLYDNTDSVYYADYGLNFG